MNAPAKMGQFVALSAAADYMGNGAIEVPIFESEIVDMVKRDSVAWSRFKRVPATGHPHRYFEQLAIGSGAFVDPRNPTATPTGPNRVERAAMVKAITNESDFSLFDRDVTRMQGQFAGLEAKDIQDIVAAILNTSAAAIWNGTDTSLSAPTTTQYMSLFAQISDQAVIAPGASIIDGIKAKVAAMVSRTDFKVKPTAIWLNGVLGDLIDKEAKASKVELGKVVVAGVTVSAIATQAGDLPLIAEAWIPNWNDARYGFAAPPAGTNNYPAVILTESMVEMPTVHGGDGNVNPRLFQLGLQSGLAAKHVGVLFNTVIAKGYTYAHSVIVVQR